MTLRPINLDDVAELEAVLRINLEDVELLAPMDEATLRRKVAIAERFDVIEVGRFACGGHDNVVLAHEL